MPKHRSSEKLPQHVLDEVHRGQHHEFFGRVHTVLGGGLRGHRIGLKRPVIHGKKAELGAPVDVQYTLKDNILTRTEFLRGLPAIPVHMAHFDPVSGKRFSTIIDCYA